MYDGRGNLHLRQLCTCTNTMLISPSYGPPGPLRDYTELLTHST